MAARFKLSDFLLFEDAEVWALSSAQPIQRLVFHLNEKLRLRLVRDTTDHSMIQRDTCLHYSSYSHYDEQAMQTWHLTANKNPYFSSDEDPSELKVGNIPLVADLKVFDYFLWCEETPTPEQSQRVSLGLKTLAYIGTFQKIDTGSSKNIKNLLTET